MTLRDLIARAVHRYDFRRRGPFEADGEYRDALIAHVESRDWAAGHELRVGRLQADWTPDDVLDFSRRMRGRQRSEHRPRLPDQMLMIEGGQLTPLTDEALLRHGAVGLDRYCDMRRQAPAKDLTPILTAALLDGRLMMMPVARGDRISVMKAFAQDMPVFGFELLFDAFMHNIDERTPVATKRDCLMQQIVTRTCRAMRRRPYEVRQGRAFFDPPPPDLDVRNPSGSWVTADDPYADVFVSVPTPTGKPS